MKRPCSRYGCTNATDTLRIPPAFHLALTNPTWFFFSSHMKRTTVYMYFELKTLCLCGITYNIYRVSQEECARFRVGVPYVKVYRYNPKHLYPKLNGYGFNGQRKVGASCGSKYCNLHSWYVTWQCYRPWEGNAVFTVPAWRFAQSAMLRHRGALSCIVLVTLRTTMTWVRVFL